MKPTRRPRNPCFSSGPCAKRPGWSRGGAGSGAGRPLAPLGHRQGADRRGRRPLARDPRHPGRLAGRRSSPARIPVRSRSRCGRCLGARGVDMLAWENFGEGWVEDVKQLKLPDVRVLHAPYGRLPDLREVDPARDVVFPWNGTTSGVRVPNGDWIAADRKGLAICDATSAVFAMRLPWDKLDVVTWSWQKALGGEAAHGMLALVAARGRTARELHPALAAAEAFPADLEGQIDQGRVPGRDDQHAVDAVRRGRARIRSNGPNRSAGSTGWSPARKETSRCSPPGPSAHRWVEFLAEDPATISCTSPQLKIIEPWFTALVAR